MSPIVCQCANSTQRHREDLGLWNESRVDRQEHSDVVRRDGGVDGTGSDPQ